MAGPRLEFFRFATYVFFPILIMARYGDPDWYNNNVYPLRDAYLQPEKADVKLSENEEELKRQLGELREQRLAKRAARLEQQRQGTSGDLEEGGRRGSQGDDASAPSDEVQRLV